MLNFKKLKSNQQGTLLIAALAASAIFLSLSGGLALLGTYKYKLYLRNTSKTQAIHIAESGVNYYRWHLAHEESDFFDGTGNDPDGIPPNGPYIHTYISPDGQLKGKFSLEIVPPEVGSTITTIKSTGWTDDFPNIKREVDVRYGIPSFSTYSIAVNSNVRFGTGTETFGPLHSNGGIRFDGIAHNLVSSAVSCYDDPDTGYSDPCEQPGVWTSQADPGAVFLSGTSYPVPAVDFTGITADLAQMKTDAQSSGFYLSYDQKGYHIHFNTNGTFDVYEVDSLMPKGWIYEGSPDGWVNTSYDIKNESLLSSANPIPSNGIIFVEANVWVDGTVNGRATVASGRFPENPNNYTNITIVNDILYNSDSGSDVLGLIAQKNVQIGYYSEDDLEINAAILAQNGRFHRPYYYYYEITRSYNLRDTITINGSMAMNNRYGLHWCCPDSGYWTRNINYDSSLVYSPPPSFPTTGEYAFISWEEKE